MVVKMKLLIASDLHGSFEYAEKLEQWIKKEQPDFIILLGDLLYPGPYHHEAKRLDTLKVAEILNSYQNKIIAVKGNCDAEEDQELLHFDMMKHYKVLEVDGLKMYFTHGIELDRVPYQDGILIHGHTHVYLLTEKEINPGSITLPRVHSEHTILLYENRCFQLVDVEHGIIGSMTL